jgi:hypothetical protein
VETFLVPAPLAERLGGDASEGLVQMFADYHQFATDRFERRLTEEIGGLRLEMYQGLAALRQDMMKLEVRLRRWSFVFWLGQMAFVAGLFSFLRS